MGPDRREQHPGWRLVALLLLPAGVVVGLGSQPAHGQAAGQLTLASHYEVQRVDSPAPATNGRFGGAIVNGGDLDGDGRADLLVPQLGTEAVHVISGATGAQLYSVTAPDPSTTGRAARFAIMTSMVEDLGSCPGGQAGQLCGNASIGPADGTPEFAVGAPGVDIDDAEDVGRAYIYDGATGALIKRLQMPPDDLASEAAVDPSLRSFSFGRSVLNPASPFPATAPEAVKLGDVDGGGVPDLVVGNSTFYEQGPTTNPACDPGPCVGSGRVCVFAGEDIAGSDPTGILDSPLHTVKNPMPDVEDPDQPNRLSNYSYFGHSLIHIGDVGGCTVDPGPGELCGAASSTNSPDGVPEVVVSALRVNHPESYIDAGVAYLIDGPTGSVLIRYDHPQPQTGALFSYTEVSGGAIGDVADNALPDVHLSADEQDVWFASQGRSWIFSGNFLATSSSIVATQLDDPTPHQSGHFGTPFAPLGDVAGDPRNEILVGAVQHFGLNTQVVSDVHVFSPATGEVLLSIVDPDGTVGGAFGSGVASLGDLNGDGHIDFAAGAQRYDAEVDGSQVLSAGRLYIFRSVAEPEP